MLSLIKSRESRVGRGGLAGVAWRSVEGGGRAGDGHTQTVFEGGRESRWIGRYRYGMRVRYVGKVCRYAGVQVCRWCRCVGV